MKNSDDFSNTYDITNLIPHCPVIMVLDTSHSMWGQGLSDLKQSLQEFSRILCQETFQDALIDIETIRMGENFGILEPFTSMQDSNVASMEIRPKGDTPLGASLELALSELRDRLDWYRSNGINFVMPQMIVLSDGESSDDFSQPALIIRDMVQKGELACRAIALGARPNYFALQKFAGDSVVKSVGASMKESFQNVGRVVSQEYEDKAEEIIKNQFQKTTPDPMEAEKITTTASDVETFGSFSEGKDSDNDLFAPDYLLDGSNILHWCKPKSVSLAAVNAIVTHLKNQGKEFMVIFDASAPHLLEIVSESEHAAYESLINNDPIHFKQTPAGTCADVFLLEEARSNHKAVILTQDLYRDHRKAYSDILSKNGRVEPGMVLNRKIFFPRLNLTIPMSQSVSSM